MLMIPFPLIVAEILVFIAIVQHWGFLNAMAIYLLPSLLGLFIVSTVGRMALMTLQTTVMRGQLPGHRILHSGAIFLSGILFLIPSFFSRVLGLVLFLPGLRHLAVWRFKIYMGKRIAQGSAKAFNFGAGPFGFGAGMGGASGFRYDFRDQGDTSEEIREEREIQAEVLDVTPIEITHKPSDDKPSS